MTLSCPRCGKEAISMYDRMVPRAGAPMHIKHAEISKYFKRAAVAACACGHHWEINVPGVIQ